MKNKSQYTENRCDNFWDFIRLSFQEYDRSWLHSLTKSFKWIRGLIVTSVSLIAIKFYFLYFFSMIMIRSLCIFDLPRGIGSHFYFIFMSEWQLNYLLCLWGSLGSVRGGKNGYLAAGSGRLRIGHCWHSWLPRVIRFTSVLPTRACRTEYFGKEGT